MEKEKSIVSDEYEFNHPLCLYCFTPILDFKRMSKHFCNHICRKAFWIEEQQRLFGDEILLIKWIKENCKILMKIFEAGVTTTNLSMLAKIGFRLNAAFVPYAIIDRKEVYKFGTMFLTITSSEEAKISKKLHD